ncbi:MAG: hypothetical protein O7167_02950 [Wolbachia endosymbiont of Andrena nigroaenea]|uniref:hypothetical protein n=1 Tax=Wolbachia endosymbiont (group A) of Andrena hattorfiana TaxID=2953977 RepID=UPI0021F83405|nr:hypothetical protein [Wolbachia endosymbiont (group A) of Andrena hattorfiana]MDX5526823.1 hypothetical protein [Wolbachia endosymbiont of Andrena nigroaenea]
MTINTNKSILKWENTAHITKMSIEGLVALASLAGAITTILIATKVIAGPASLALVASPAGIAVLFIAAVYFAAAAYASYQQMQKNEEIGVNGKDGKDANFAALVGDVLKNGTIVKETVKKDGENDVQQLFLTLPIADYKELAKNNEPVHILLANGKVVELDHKVLDANATEYKVQLTSVAGKDQPADMKAELGMAADSKSLKVVVSDKDLEALKNGVSTKLGEVAVDAALSKMLSK